MCGSFWQECLERENKLHFTAQLTSHGLVWVTELDCFEYAYQRLRGKCYLHLQGRISFDIEDDVMYV
jgi:hypothetical protein